jgi:ferredoxin--NADP+ reductase
MTAEQLYIDPATCIDCSACMTECPVSAIFDEHNMPAEYSVYRDMNAEYFTKKPLEIFYPERKPRRVLTAEQPTLRVAVVGAGASGCYAAEELAQVPGVVVSLFDRRPTPFGLVRTGVAPDHESTKQISAVFDKTLKRSNVQCFFNVDVGTDVSIEEVLETHHAAIIAVGAAMDRKLGIPGEGLPGMTSAREFVAWYNADLDSEQSFELDSERVVIIGNGNVALDVARVLAAPDDHFGSTDMADHGLHALRRSKVREVVVVARRGPGEAAYTVSELLQLDQLEGVDIITVPEEVAFTSGSAEESSAVMSERKIAMNAGFAAARGDSDNRRVVFRYFLEPVSADGDTAVQSVTFRSALNGELETIEAGLVLRSIGYQAAPLEGLPLDPDGRRLSNTGGRIVEPGNADPVPGLYCVGWAKRGPVGVIGSNKVDAKDTVDSLFADYAGGRLDDPPMLDSDVSELVAKRQPDFVDFEGWTRIDRVERDRGRPLHRPRSKFTNAAELLTASRA